MIWKMNQGQQNVYDCKVQQNLSPCWISKFSLKTIWRKKRKKKTRKQLPKFSLVRNCHKNHFSSASVTLKSGQGHQIGMNVSSSINVCRWGGGGGRQANIKLCLKAKNMWTISVKLVHAKATQTTCGMRWSQLDGTKIYWDLPHSTVAFKSGQDHKDWHKTVNETAIKQSLKDLVDGNWSKEASQEWNKKQLLWMLWKWPWILLLCAQHSVPVASRTRPKYSAKVLNTSQANLFSLSLGCTLGSSNFKQKKYFYKHYHSKQMTHATGTIHVHFQANLLFTLVPL